VDPNQGRLNGASASNGAAPALNGDAPAARENKAYAAFVQDLARKLNASMQGNARHLYRSQLLALVDSEARTSLAEAGIPATHDLMRGIVREVMDELIGLGPLQSLLDDPAVTEIMVNGPDQVWIERGGKLSESGTKFRARNFVPDSDSLPPRSIHT